MTGELKNFIIDFKNTMFDDTDTIKFELINETYKKSRKLTIEEVKKMDIFNIQFFLAGFCIKK